MQRQSEWAMITGGSRGIGRAIALALGDAGLRVLVVYRERQSDADEVVSELEAQGVAAIAVQVDLASESAAPILHDLADNYEISTLVNCAGITADRTLLKLSEGDWQRVLDTNLTGAYRAIAAVLPGQRERNSGRIVNISSIIAQTGNIGQTNYAASKAGLIGLTKSLALETARFDITVNAVCPGFIETEMLTVVPPEARATILERIPKGRFGRPEEVADAVRFLVSPRAAYITGAVLNVNGGMYL